MPRRSRKSKAAEKREQKNVEYDKCDIENIQTSFSKNELSQEINLLLDRKVVSGTLHQGDPRFQYPGVQCTYISYFALISMELKRPHLWTSQDIDTCVINGNFGFMKHCIERKLQPQMLMANELPEYITVQTRAFKCHQCESEIKVGTLTRKTDEEINHISDTLSEALQHTLHSKNSCLLFCGGQTVAIAKQESMYYIFDPHSRGKDGFLHHTGSAVLVSFVDIHSLTLFIERLLTQSLRLRASEQFELVPITISLESDTDDVNKPKLDAATSSRKIESRIQESKEPYEKAQSTVTAIHQNCTDQKVTSELCAQAIDSYFVDQKQRDMAHKEKHSSSKTSDVLDMNRKEYMRKYMKKKRETDSFRKQENSLAKSRMKNIRSTAEGRRQNIERAAEGMRSLLDTKEGRLKHNQMSSETMKRRLASEEAREKHRERSVKRMKKMLSTDEGRQKHNNASAEVMKKLRSTKEGRLKHNRRSVEDMKKLRSTTEGRQKHKVRSVEGMKKLLSTTEGRQKHNVRSVEGMKKLRSTTEGRQKHNVRSVEGMKKLRSTTEGRLKHNVRSAEGMKKLLSTEEGRQKHNVRSAQGMKKLLSTEAGKEKHNVRSAEGMKKIPEY